MDYGIFRNYIWVASAFELSCRHDNLSFTAHHEIAAARKRTRYNMEEETEVCEVSPLCRIYSDGLAYRKRGRDYCDKLYFSLLG